MQLANDSAADRTFEFKWFHSGEFCPWAKFLVVEDPLNKAVVVIAGNVDCHRSIPWEGVSSQGVLIGAGRILQSLAIDQFFSVELMLQTPEELKDPIRDVIAAHADTIRHSWHQ